MSAPYGQPPAASPPGSGPSRTGGPDLAGILALVGTALGLVIYFCSFSEDAQLSVGLLVYLLLAAGLLAAATLLPKAPSVLVPAAVLSAVGSLGVLSAIVTTPEGVDLAGLVIVILVLGLLQTAALVAALLIGAGVVSMRPRQAPYQAQQWGGPQYGTQPGQYAPGQYGQVPPGQYGQPQPGQYPGQGSFNQPTQQQPAPGQYGQGTGQYPPEYGQTGEQPRPGDGPDGPGYGQPGTPPGGGAGPERS